MDALGLISPVTPGGRLGRIDRALAHPLFGPPLLRTGFGLVGHSLSLRPVRRIAAAALPGLRYEDVLATAAQWRTAPVWRSFYIEQRALAERAAGAGPGARFDRRPRHGRDRHPRPDRLPAQRGGAGARAAAGTLVTVEGAGHLLPQQRPGIVARAILDLGARH